MITVFIYTFEIWVCEYLTGYTGYIVNGLSLRVDKYNKNLGSHSEARLQLLQELFGTVRRADTGRLVAV